MLSDTQTNSGLRGASHKTSSEAADGRFVRNVSQLNAGYRGRFVDWVEATLAWSVAVVKHWWTGVRAVWVPDGAEPPETPAGFHVLPRRWVVERTFAWLGRYRQAASLHGTRRAGSRFLSVPGRGLCSGALSDSACPHPLPLARTANDPQTPMMPIAGRS